MLPPLESQEEIISSGFIGLKADAFPGVMHFRVKYQISPRYDVSSFEFQAMELTSSVEHTSTNSINKLTT